jgi:gamma-glutamylcysteine synthetase
MRAARRSLSRQFWFGKGKYPGDLQSLVHTGDLLDVREYYSPVRIKPAKGNDFVEALLQQGIAYLELRMIDLNPLCKNGISIETMQFIHLFLILMLFLENKPFGGATFCGVDMIIQDIEGCHRHQLLHY